MWITLGLNLHLREYKETRATDFLNVDLNIAFTFTLLEMKHCEVSEFKSREITFTCSFSKHQ